MRQSSNLTNMHFARITIFAVGSALSGAGCANANEEAFDYGLDEVRAGIEGDWVGDTSPVRNSQLKLTLAYKAPDVRTQCGSRTLSESIADTEKGLATDIHPLCSSETTANLTGMLTVPRELGAGPRDGAETSEFTGSLLSGLHFTGASVWGASDRGRIEATLSDGTLSGTFTGTGVNYRSVTFSFKLTRAK